MMMMMTTRQSEGPPHPNRWIFVMTQLVEDTANFDLNRIGEEEDFGASDSNEDGVDFAEEEDDNETK